MKNKLIKDIIVVDHAKQQQQQQHPHQQLKINAGNQEQSSNNGNVIQQTIIINSSNFNIHCDQKQQHDITSNKFNTNNNISNANIYNNTDMQSQFFQVSATPSNNTNNIRSKSTHNHFKAVALTTSKNARQHQAVISPFKDTSPNPNQDASILIAKRQRSTPTTQNNLNWARNPGILPSNNVRSGGGGGGSLSPGLVLPVKSQQLQPPNDTKISGLKDIRAQILRQVHNLQAQEIQGYQQQQQQQYLGIQQQRQQINQNNGNINMFQPSNFISRTTVQNIAAMQENQQKIQPQQLNYTDKETKANTYISPHDFLLQHLANSKPLNQERAESTRTRTLHRQSQQQQQQQQQQPRERQQNQQQQIRRKQEDNPNYIHRFHTLSNDSNSEYINNSNSTAGALGNTQTLKSTQKQIPLNQQSTSPNLAEASIVRFKNNTIDIDSLFTKKNRFNSSGHRRKSPSLVPRSNSQNARRTDSFQTQFQQQQQFLGSQKQQQQSQQEQLDVINGDEQARNNNNIKGSINHRNSLNNKIKNTGLEGNIITKQSQGFNSTITPLPNNRNIVTNGSNSQKKTALMMIGRPNQEQTTTTTAVPKLQNSNNFNEIMKIYNDTHLSKFTGNDGNTRFHRRYHSNLRTGATNARAKTEMEEEDYTNYVDATGEVADDCVSESLNILNQFNDLDAQASSKQLLLRQHKDDKSINSRKSSISSSKDISKTIDETAKLYLQESDIPNSSRIRTQQDLEKFMKSGLKAFQKNQNQTQQNSLKQEIINPPIEKRKHSASLFSTIKENQLQQHPNINDYCYNFDLEV